MNSVTLRLRKAFVRLANDVDLDSHSKNIALRRFKAEGVGFFTKTLPIVSKAVLAGIETGFFDYRLVSQFERKGMLLRFCRSLLLEIFDQKGRLLPSPDPTALWRLRQLCEYMYKLAFSFTKKQQAKALEAFKTCEQRVENFTPDSAWVALLRRNLHREHPEFVTTTVDEILGSYRPRTTSGAFFGSENLIDDWTFYEWKLLDDYTIGTTRTDFAAFSGLFKSYPSAQVPVTLVDEGKTSKVMFVPKDSRKPRVISKEPLHLLRAQMSYFDWSTELLSRTTRGRIQFRDQTQNQDLAKRGSLNRENSTLDLKEASDSLSYRLISDLFQHTSGPRWFVTNARATSTIVPGVGKIALSKLSGMGSGLTFPTMALLIHLSICSMVVKRTGYDYRYVSDQVYVYGDDVIVPRGWTFYAKDALVASGLNVNSDKCFTYGNFRESCGGDYFLGNDVAPVRLTMSNAGLDKPAEVIEIDSPIRVLEIERHCRNLVKGGLIGLADYYYGLIETVVGPLPFVTGDNPALGRYSIVGKTGTDERIKCKVPVPVKGWLGLCHDGHKHLAQHLRKGPLPSAIDRLMEISSMGTSYGEVVIPREIKLVTKKIPHWCLVSATPA